MVMFRNKMLLTCVFSCGQFVAFLLSTQATHKYFSIVNSKIYIRVRDSSTKKKYKPLFFNCGFYFHIILNYCKTKE